MQMLAHGIQQNRQFRPGTIAPQQALLRCRIEDRSPMRMYSPDELDLMAEAYNRLAHRLPYEVASTETTMRLVEEIAAGVSDGVRDAAASPAQHSIAPASRPTRPRNSNTPSQSPCRPF